MSAGVVPVDHRRRWRDALDSFASGLTAAQRAMAASEDPDPEIDGPAGRDAIEQRRIGGADTSGSVPTRAWPPGELPAGPVPDELRAEAESLLQRADTLRDELLAAMQRSRPTGRRSGTPMAASPRWSIRL